MFRLGCTPKINPTTLDPKPLRSIQDAISVADESAVGELFGLSVLLEVWVLGTVFGDAFPNHNGDS